MSNSNGILAFAAGRDNVGGIVELPVNTTAPCVSDTGLLPGKSWYSNLISYDAPSTRSIPGEMDKISGKAALLLNS